MREENPHLSQSRSGNGDEGGGGGGRSGPKIDAKESGQHLQAESKTDGETDGRTEDVGAGGRTQWDRRTAGKRRKGEREKEREGREHLRISLKKPSEKGSEGGRRRSGGAQVFGLEMQLLNVRIELSCSARERKRETGRERNCLGDVSPSPQPREEGGERQMRHVKLWPK